MSITNEHIWICGGGNLGHVIAGLAAYKGYKVSVLTRKPELWNSSLIVKDLEGNTFTGKLTTITKDASQVIPQADIILLCLPGYAIEEELLYIRPFIKDSCHIGSVVSSTGFFFTAFRILGAEISLFGFQRSPFISRIKEYGQIVNLLGYKKELQVATFNNKDPKLLQVTLQNITNTPVCLLNHFLEASLTNSNPILHPVRLYSLFHSWTEEEVYPKKLNFYSNWDDESSELLITCDNEFQKTIKALPIQIKHIPTLLDYYESYDCSSLTQKIRSIKAFQDIKAPMKEVSNGYIPDFNNRYFTEDFPFGLLIIKSIAEIFDIDTPYINKILKWGQKMIGKEYLQNNILTGKDLNNTGYINKELFNRIINQTK